MDRCAIFVDAGYLFAEGGKLCGFGPARPNIELDGQAASQYFESLATSLSALPSLRTYWYDGAKDGIPTRDQQEIAALPNVKLRLGRINSQNQQKGVDALIYRDLMTLARERAISDAFLLSGDEDLREGVKAAQDMGVRVTLIGIEASTSGGNQSRELQNEADRVIVLKEDQVHKFIRGRSSAAEYSISTGDPVTTESSAAETTARPSMPSGSSTIRDDLTMSVSDAADKYAEQWATRTTKEALDSLLAGYPRIPGQLDLNLLIYIENRINESLRKQESLRHAARRAFWNRIKSASELSDH